MTDEDNADLVALLREPGRPADDAFVRDVEWLIELDCAFLRRRRTAFWRWAVDLGSVGTVGGVAYVLAGNAPVDAGAWPTLFAPLVAATAVPVLWLLARSSTSAA